MTLFAHSWSKGPQTSPQRWRSGVMSKGPLLRMVILTRMSSWRPRGSLFRRKSSRLHKKVKGLIKAAIIHAGHSRYRILQKSPPLKMVLLMKWYTWPTNPPGQNTILNWVIVIANPAPFLVKSYQNPKTKSHSPENRRIQMLAPTMRLGLLERHNFTGLKNQVLNLIRARE